MGREREKEGEGAGRGGEGREEAQDPRDITELARLQPVCIFYVRV